MSLDIMCDITPGPYVTFYAIIFLRQWRIVSLTPPLSVSQGEDRMALYAAFSGALDLLSQIDEDAARIMKDSEAAPPLTVTPIEPADYKLPCISALPKYHGTRTP
jgi:hypothetical protein